MLIGVGSPTTPRQANPGGAFGGAAASSKGGFANGSQSYANHAASLSNVGAGRTDCSAAVRVRPAVGRRHQQAQAVRGSKGIGGGRRHRAVAKRLVSNDASKDANVTLAHVRSARDLHQALTPNGERCTSGWS
jgi:hypothetical protein